MGPQTMDTFERLESEVRGYCRSWPVVFASAEGCELIAEDGTRYLDLFAGAGALNYGHNHPALIEPLIDHLRSSGIVHGLDMATTTKRTFLERFDEVVLRPRGLDYKVQFPGPTGTNAVESALKLARKITGRERVVGFTNAFHGMTLGSLAVTGNSMKRNGAGIPLTLADSMPFEGFLGDDVNTLDYFEAYLEGDSSGLDMPAAVILETTQAEGGIHTASAEWLLGLQDLCRRFEIPLIVDDIQVGCGRTGPFFSWERIGLDPDIVCLSKSLSGSGLPMAVVLMKPELDLWEPGEHNGTFRGNNAAFVTATAALDTFWTDDELTTETARKADVVRSALEGIAAEHPGLVADVRGTGLIQGLGMTVPEAAGQVTRKAFERGMIIETAGPNDEVVKLLPPLVIGDDQLERALTTLAECVQAVVDQLGDDLVSGEVVS
jgi:diaminobutyrate-2-oxoglutarate transaminase